MTTENQPPNITATTDDKPRTFTPTQRQSELEALRQRGLTTQLNRHFNEQVAKETAAVQTALEHLKKRQSSNNKTTTTTTATTANRDISPLDAVYLSITKWRRECRQKERELRNQCSHDSPLKVDAKATTKKVELPALNVPVSDAAKHIETVLGDYLKTGALELPSVESLGKEVTFATAHQEHATTENTCQLKTNEVDARCTPTAEQINVYVGPGAFQDVSLECVDSKDENQTTGDDIDDYFNEVCAEIDTSSVIAPNDERKMQTSPENDIHGRMKDCSDVDLDLFFEDAAPDDESIKSSPENSDPVNDTITLAPKNCTELDTMPQCPTEWEAPPALVSSTRSTDSTNSFSPRKTIVSQRR